VGTSDGFGVGDPWVYVGSKVGDFEGDDVGTAVGFCVGLPNT